MYLWMFAYPVENRCYVVFPDLPSYPSWYNVETMVSANLSQKVCLELIEGILVDLPCVRNNIESELKCLSVVVCAGSHCGIDQRC